MRYQGTAVQIYDTPSLMDPRTRFDRQMARLVAAVCFLGLAAFGVFVLFGIVTQRM
jgi:hypothetical protein